MLARRPTRSGASIPSCLRFCTWVRISSRKGAAMVPASTFLALAAGCFLVVMVVDMLLVTGDLCYQDGLVIGDYEIGWHLMDFLDLPFAHPTYSLDPTPTDDAERRRPPFRTIINARIDTNTQAQVVLHDATSDAATIHTMNPPACSTSTRRPHTPAINHGSHWNHLSRRCLYIRWHTCQKQRPN